MSVATFHFNPERVAYFEAEGWRAYYDRRWLRVLYLLVSLCQEQFRIPFPISLLAAYYTTRASIAWVPEQHDLKKVLNYLEKFYRLAGRYSSLKFDYKRVAALELQYFDVHRRLVDSPDKSEFVQTMTDLHSALFGLTPEQVRESAIWRVEAATIVDQITHDTSVDKEKDWTRLEQDLRKCYISIQQALAA